MRAFKSAILAVAVLSAATSGISAQGWGHIKARFVYGGDYQAPPKLQLTKDVALCSKFGLVDESLVVNAENKGIANVIVFYRDKVPAKIHPSYNELIDQPIKLENFKCRFEPHVTPVWIKRKLEVFNKDPVGHNVKVDTFFNPAINPILPAGTSLQQGYSMEERLPSKVGCSIHSWMAGWLVIRTDPYVGVSNSDGLLEIKNVPAGEFEFQFWQERAGYVQQVTQGGKSVEWVRGRVKIKIEEGKTTDLGDIVIGADQFK